MFLFFRGVRVVCCQVILRFLLSGGSVWFVCPILDENLLRAILYFKSVVPKLYVSVHFHFSDHFGVPLLSGVVARGFGGYIGIFIPSGISLRCTVWEPML